MEVISLSDYIEQKKTNDVDAIDEFGREITIEYDNKGQPLIIWKGMRKN